MKISNTTTNYINQAYKNQNSPKPPGQKPAPPADEPQTDNINLSSRTREMQKINRALENEPADRKQYVAEIKARVESNRYDINAENIAERMIRGRIDKIV